MNMPKVLATADLLLQAKKPVLSALKYPSQHQSSPISMGEDLPPLHRTEALGRLCLGGFMPARLNLGEHSAVEEAATEK